MRLAQPRTRGRSSFTLIELLVVISIIAILVGLTAAGVIKYLEKIPVIQTTNDIQQLATALESFKTKFGFYPPSRIKLALLPTMAYYPNQNTVGSLDQLSLAYLNQMFPRMTWPQDWSGGMAGFQSVILEGDECLVFFLGGIPTGPTTNPASVVPGCLGFSADPHNPAALPNVANNQRINPFFTFTSDRLVQNHLKDGVNPSGFYSYRTAYDNNSAVAYQNVFAYFSSGKTPNGYNSFFADATLGAKMHQSDCNFLTVWPYAEFMSAGDTRPPRYLNPTTFQIIAAGKDGIFGRGTAIGAQTATAIVGAAPVTTWTGNNPGGMGLSGNYNYKDDQSNFAPGILEAGS